MSQSIRDNLKRLLAPRHLAFVGGRSMARALKRCAEGGFGGELWLINPQHESLEGIPCVAHVGDLPYAPDAVFIATNRELTLQCVAELAARGAGGAICYASGFAESGEEGRQLQQRLLAAAGNMALLGPNCYGLLDYLHGAALWPVAHGGKPVEKGVAILTQSGNFAYNLSMSDRSLPVAYMASVGNQAQLGVAELMDVMLDDPRVTAIGLHLEGVKNVPGFARAAYKALQQGTPIIALKTGVSQIGAELALSHTSSLSGSDALYDSLFQRLGVIRVSGPVSFVETLKAAACGRLPAEGELIALACSGGDAGLIADYAERNHLHLPKLEQGQVTALAEVLPAYANLVNPLDFTTAIWGDEAALQRMLDSTLSGAADAAMLVLDYPAAFTGERKECDLLLALYCDALERHGKIGFVTSAFPELLPASARERLHARGIAALQGVEDGLAAWGRIVAYQRNRQRLLEQGEAARVPLCPQAVTGEGRLLDEWQAKQALRAFGLPVPAGVLSTPERAVVDAARVGYPLVLKAVSAQLPHKTEAGAVALNLRDAAALEAALVQMRQRIAAYAPQVAFDQILLEPMAAPPLAELIVGIKREHDFALALVIGAGGVLVELLKDSVSLLLPTTDSAIRAALLSLRSASLLQGFRGRPAADLDALVAAIRAVADYACENAGQLLELDVNPLMVGAHGTLAVDALIRLGQAQGERHE
ncbi:MULTISPECIES: acetate--CoA ligase family protein [Pseudomonas]|uniref:Acetate--CoA ligase family protein n=1 Tax=Pseudomonas putida TaxID=303 RepID=A0A1L7NE79_PSEPU|nr:MULTISPECIES: acetate--CoA ligase family protein [Pseudomonas]MBH3450547.1 acetate--CoA ligase family protein [Pseudomonas putida]MBP2082813.1 acyl-CoA synthetase (NDP forming) [Pseudomonas sp. PvP089]MBP2091484.1 acyl-CoA synthetase (NDP forming) [Pseudomonas sp. PvP088]MBP2222353.1 acyl-CoA synthetase (NDP forming) [Pseudomonas putida]MDO1496331.1 acetate--CoA ligase family protein [Pseudomonas putida]